MSFEIIHKPTFTNQLLTIPKERVVQVLEKIEVLRKDPKPHGSLKKKLHGYEGAVYRLRSGDYRIIYTYGDGWVSLLGVDSRKDVYRGTKLYAEEATIDIKKVSNLELLLLPHLTSQPLNSPLPPEDPLPLLPTEDLLTQLLIPASYFPLLLPCKTLDDLLTANIPTALRDRLFDCLTNPNFDQVLHQPDLRTGDPNDLLRFKEGELLGFLLHLNPEQEKFVTWSLKASGPTLVKGSPGTGKSTIALYRVRTLIEHLKSQGTPHPRILFTTYTNALVTFSRQLLDSLLGDDLTCVSVKTADAIVYNLLTENGPKPTIATDADLRKALQKALPNAIATLDGNLLQQQAQRQILQRLTPDYLLQELNTLIDGRTILKLEDYQVTARNGRSIALNKIQRQAIWHLRQLFLQHLKTNNLETWSQLRNRALTIVESAPNLPKYDAVIIDEAQDLDPNILRLLTTLCIAPNRLFVTADANQSIYGSGFRWQDIHTDLKFTGRTGILRTNHRTTREISEAAHSYLCDSQLDPDSDDRDYIHTGPSPAVRSIATHEDEAQLLTQFCKTATREFRLGINACAILVPNETIGRNLAGRLTYLGLPAQYMGSKDLDLNSPQVKVINLKAAKGLEFPIVAIAGFLGAAYPKIPKGSPEAEMQELLARERRTLFVGMTRAMRALLILIPTSKPSPLLQSFDNSLWNLGQPA